MAQSSVISFIYIFINRLSTDRRTLYISKFANKSACKKQEVTMEIQERKKIWKGKKTKENPERIRKKRNPGNIKKN